ncbi:DNA gyrase subunit A [Candidatus Woesearchaeota archaeon]|nr:DNA gyrase subunit A [Candidatus Woesearchaeota archaeon]
MEDKKQPEEQKKEKIVPAVIEDEMKSSYLDYSMSVIVGRALPDIRDGLKPVHRRILYAMYKMGMLHNKPFKKSARIVGEVLGKYHPHGDAAVYDAMVRMTQDFAMRYPLVQGQGNFGSVDGDNAAAMRYTEARLMQISEEILQDIDKNTVKFIPNFDGSLKEPVLLPSKVPNLLINGSSGIAVGMATNIPPHNVTEICNGIISLIENPEISVEQIMQKVTAPDFPTGATICGTDGIRQAYKTGKGKIRVRANASVEETKTRTRIIVTEIPYQVNKSALIEEIASLVRDKKIQGIVDLRDESDRTGMRIVIDLKQGANPDVVLNQLYKHTNMQTTFGVIMLGLVNNEPKILNLKQMMAYFVDHRKNVVKKRTKFELDKADEKAHILEGIIVALNNVDDVVALIKSSKTVESAKAALESKYKLSDKQAQAILEMRLQRLTSLEQEKLKKDHQDTIKLISDLKEILGSEHKVFEIIKKELSEIKEKYGDKRRTQVILGGDSEIEVEDLIKPENVVVTISHAGYIKRIPVSTYKEQKRGGKGVIAAGKKEEDFIEDLFVANTHSSLLFFTNKGKVHWLKVYQIPEATRQAKGTAIVNLIQLEKDEKIATYVPVDEFKSDLFITIATKHGTVKRTSLDNFSNPRRGGIVAIAVNKGDELIDARLTDGKKELVIATSEGMAVRFNETDIRPMGRTAAGVRGIKIKGADRVVGMVVAEESKTLLTVTENGFGKRTEVSDYRLINRGGVGVINLKITEKNGKVSSIMSVSDEDGIMFITKNGIIIRIAAKDISVIGRNTQGVRVMKLGEGDSLAAAAKIPNEE